MPGGPPEEAVMWHLAECGGYDADMPHWLRLADRWPGPVLDLGCGAGRVAAGLARSGHEVLGVDLDPVLVERFNLTVPRPSHAVVGDVTDLDLDQPFGLVIAPQQLVQIVGGARERAAMLESAMRVLKPGGAIVLTTVEPLPHGSYPAAPVPDVREEGGWVYSSLPIEVVSGQPGLTVRRLRQRVAPEGELAEHVDEVLLRRLGVAALTAEAHRLGLAAQEAVEIPATEHHMASSLVVLRPSRPEPGRS